MGTYHSACELLELSSLVLARQALIVAHTVDSDVLLMFLHVRSIQAYVPDDLPRRPATDLVPRGQLLDATLDGRDATLLPHLLGREIGMHFEARVSLSKLLEFVQQCCQESLTTSTIPVTRDGLGIKRNHSAEIFGYASQEEASAIPKGQHQVRDLNAIC